MLTKLVGLSRSCVGRRKIPFKLINTSYRSFSNSTPKQKWTILITGANRGLGLEFTKQYIVTGNYNIIACCRSPEKSSELQQISKNFPQSIAVEKLDVTSEKDIETVSKKYESQPIDIVILNAGVMSEKDDNTGERRRIGNLTKQDLLNTFNTNVIGPLLITQAFFENVSLSERKQFVAISSAMASIQDNTGNGGAVSYRVSKCGLNCGLQDVKLKDSSIHTLLLHPGWVQTDMGGNSAYISTEESVDNMIQVIDNYKNIPNGAFWNYTNQPFGSTIDSNGVEKYPTGKW